MSIRKRRRDRTLSRIAHQKKLDDIAYIEINKNPWEALFTIGGSRCPDCLKPLPSRAFSSGYHENIGIAIVSVGSSVQPEFCHEDRSRCHHESTTSDKSFWTLANDYIPNKKELKKDAEYREWFNKKYGTNIGENC